MNLSILIEGVVIGFLMAVPIGPVGTLCVRRTFSKGVLSGLFTGLGAATADACYSAIAAFGLTYILNFLIRQKAAIQMFGIICLLYLGIRMFSENPVLNSGKKEINHKSLIGDYGSGFIMTLTNPSTIFTFMAIFAGIGLSTAGHYGSAVILVLGVFLGSTLWWLVLSYGIGRIRQKTSHVLLKRINRLSGIITLVFALGLLISLIRQ